MHQTALRSKKMDSLVDEPLVNRSLGTKFIGAEGMSGQLDTKAKLSFGLLVALVSSLLVLNILSYCIHGLQNLWTFSLVLCGIYFIFLVLNSVVQELGILCWPNIFLTLMVIFHLGYYMPLQWGLIEKSPINPDLNNPLIPFAMTLLAAAIITFEAGVLLSLRISGPEKEKPQKATTAYELKMIFRFGVLITTLSVLLLLIYIVETGGIMNILKMSYSDYMQFLSSSDPRAIATSLVFLPIGLLLIYIGIDRSNTKKSKLYSRLIIFVVFLLTVWQFWLGSRGTAFLLALSFVYIRHIWVKRYRQKDIIALLVIILAISIILIPIIKEIRNLPVSERGASLSNTSLDPLDALVEMGGTIRPYVGFFQVFPPGGAEAYLHGKSYVIALGRIIPNVGFSVTRDSTQSYFRTNIWITQRLDPAAASVGIGLGSSGVAEPYINFGYFGLLIFFFLLGLGITLLERYTIRNRSILAVALIAFMFSSVNWYIRDDIYGVIRPIAWGLISLLVLYLLFKRNRLESETP